MPREMNTHHNALKKQIAGTLPNTTQIICLIFARLFCCGWNARPNIRILISHIYNSPLVWDQAPAERTQITLPFCYLSVALIRCSEWTRNRSYSDCFRRVPDSGCSTVQVEFLTTTIWTGSYPHFFARRQTRGTYSRHISQSSTAQGFRRSPVSPRYILLRLLSSLFCSNCNET